jgi:hypothetical protein
MLEVTKSKDRHALLSFGLTAKCGLATLVFRELSRVFMVLHPNP